MLLRNINNLFLYFRFLQIVIPLISFIMRALIDHSTFLSTTYDANYSFLLVDIGALGRCSDVSVYRNSAIDK